MVKMRHGNDNDTTNHGMEFIALEPMLRCCRRRRHVTTLLSLLFPRQLLPVDLRLALNTNPDVTFDPPACVSSNPPTPAFLLPPQGATNNHCCYYGTIRTDHTIHINDSGEYLRYSLTDEVILKLIALLRAAVLPSEDE